jgi:thiol-disulfide isomerase/thioredoxin
VSDRFEVGVRDDKLMKLIGQQSIGKIKSYFAVARVGDVRQPDQERLQMHRQNLFVFGLLGIVFMAVLAVGYSTGRGPIDVISAGVARLSRSSRGHSQMRSLDAPRSDNPVVVAPEFAAGEWINSEPLTLKGLRGKVVLIDFWTFGCYNCRNTLPAIKDWDARYREKGLTIVGVHSPEFAEEKQLENLRREVASLGIRYPVVTDNDYATWKAYNVEAWPTIVLLDKQGRVRWTHLGEGAYDETEEAIQKLLSEE